jgi:hypothetical protein
MGTFCQRRRGVTVLDIYYVRFMNRIYSYSNYHNLVPLNGNSLPIFCCQLLRLTSESAAWSEWFDISYQYSVLSTSRTTT